MLVWIAVFVRTVWYFAANENRDADLPNYLLYWLPTFAILIIGFYEYLIGVRFREYSTVIASRVIGALILTPGILISVAWTYSSSDTGAMLFIGMFLNYLGLCFVHAENWYVYCARAFKDSDSTEP